MNTLFKNNEYTYFAVTHEKVDKIESEIFKEIEERDKEEQPKETVASKTSEDNVTKRLVNKSYCNTFDLTLINLFLQTYITIEQFSVCYVYNCK